MLKKIFVLSLISIVAIAVGASIYHANAAPQVNGQEEVLGMYSSAPTTAEGQMNADGYIRPSAPIQSPDQPTQPQVDTSTATSMEESPSISQPGTGQVAPGQSQGFRGGGRNGNSRQSGRGAQASAALGANAGQAGGTDMSEFPGQGTASPSGRPSWAGQGRGRQP